MLHTDGTLDAQDPMPFTCLVCGTLSPAAHVEVVTTRDYNVAAKICWPHRGETHHWPLRGVPGEPWNLLEDSRFGELRLRPRERRA